MFRKLVALAVVALSGFASAYQSNSNLIDLKIEDICSTPRVIVETDGKTDKALEDKIISSLKELDISYGSNIFEDKDHCNTSITIQVSIISIESRLGITGYAYRTDFLILPFSVSKIVLFNGRSLSLSTPIIFRIGAVGTTGPAKSQLEAEVTEMTESHFQDFALEWLAEH